MPAPQLAWPVEAGFFVPPTLPPPVPGDACAAVVPAGLVEVEVAVVVVGEGVAAAVVAVGVVVVGVAPDELVEATLPPLALQLAAALALGAAVALGVALAGVSVDFASPPQATMTADVPSAASVVARFVSERFGRILCVLPVT